MPEPTFSAAYRHPSGHTFVYIWPLNRLDQLSNVLYRQGACPGEPWWMLSLPAAAGIMERARIIRHLAETQPTREDD